VLRKNEGNYKVGVEPQKLQLKSKEELRKLNF